MAERGLAALALALLVGGCGLGQGPAPVDGPVTVYLSLPLSGPRAAVGRDAADGARLALERAEGKAGELEVEARVLDDAARGRPFDLARVGANARAAAGDSSTAAYIGELDSGPTRTSLPILNDAGVAQVSPGATALDLTQPDPQVDGAPEIYRPSGEISFVRVIPNEAQVNAIGAGSSVDAALAPESLTGPGAAFVAQFRRRFGREPGPHAAYGYEAMAVILGAIAGRDTGGEEFRSSVASALPKTERGEDSLLGPYSFTTDGDTTLCLVQPFRGAVPLKPVCATG